MKCRVGCAEVGDIGDLPMVSSAVTVVSWWWHGTALRYICLGMDVALNRRAGVDYHVSK